jgi:hypothetical protein
MSAITSDTDSLPGEGIMTAVKGYDAKKAAYDVEFILSDGVE